jgi:hypothetical protein
MDLQNDDTTGDNRRVGTFLQTVDPSSPGAIMRRRTGFPVRRNSLRGASCVGLDNRQTENDYRLRTCIPFTQSVYNIGCHCGTREKHHHRRLKSVSCSKAMSEGNRPVEPTGENTTSSTPKKRQHVQDDDRDNPPPLTINSLKDLNVQFAPDIIQHLSLPHKEDQEYVKRLRKAMKRPVSTTTCRVNLINATRKQVLKELKVILFSMPNLDIRENSLFLDVIDIKDNSSEDRSADLSACTKPKLDSCSTSSSLFANWPRRQEKGWPMSHRALLCDRLCGEAVLRGSDIFVRGILAADPGIHAGETVAVYADIPLQSNEVHRKKIARGILLENYHGNCVFLGLGTMKCSRCEIFSQSSGIAVSMSLEASERVGPLLPPLSGVLTDKMMLQNLPSILVAHALKPQPGDFILDMCAAPGGKTAHLASLVNNQATIVACDRSRKKMLAAKELFERLGAFCITPLALDSTRCVNSYEDKSVAEVRYLKIE